MKHFRIALPTITLTLLCSCAAIEQPASAPAQAMAAPRHDVDYAAGFAYIPAGALVTINAHGYCRVVSVAKDAPALAQGGSLVVPFKSEEEWQSFRAASSQGVTLAGC